MRVCLLPVVVWASGAESGGGSGVVIAFVLATLLGGVIAVHATVCTPKFVALVRCLMLELARSKFARGGGEGEAREGGRARKRRIDFVQNVQERSSVEGGGGRRGGRARGTPFVAETLGRA